MNPEINALIEDIFWRIVALQLLIAIALFCLYVWITRWIFRVNKAVKLLEEINAKLDGLAREPIKWDDIMPPKNKE